MSMIDTPMTVARAQMLSDALTQYIDNTDDVKNPSMADTMKLALAQMMLEEIDAFLADVDLIEKRQ